MISTLEHYQFPPRSRNPIRKRHLHRAEPPPPPPLSSQRLWKTLSWYWIKESSPNGQWTNPSTSWKDDIYWHFDMGITQYIHVWRIEMSVWLPKRVEREGRFSVLTDRRQVSPSDMIELAIELRSQVKMICEFVSFTSLLSQQTTNRKKE